MKNIFALFNRILLACLELKTWAELNLELNTYVADLPLPYDQHNINSNWFIERFSNWYKRLFQKFQFQFFFFRKTWSKWIRRTIVQYAFSPALRTKQLLATSFKPIAIIFSIQTAWISGITQVGFFAIRFLVGLRLIT